MFKHSVLFSALQHVAQQQSGVLYLETHSAAGSYNLDGEQAKKTKEADSGIRSLIDGPSPCPAMEGWLDFVKQRGLTSYPGSPLLAQHCLRANDRMIFFELHPTEHEKLKSNLGDEARARVIKDDGYRGALKIEPRRGENLVVFLDPSYETERDMDALANWLPRAMKRWPRAMFLVWLPLFRDERELEFGQFVSSLDYGFVAGTRWEEFSTKESALEGSAIIGLRTPPAIGRSAYQIAEALDKLWG